MSRETVRTRIHRREAERQASLLMVALENKDRQVTELGTRPIAVWHLSRYHNGSDPEVTPGDRQWSRVPVRLKDDWQRTTIRLPLWGLGFFVEW